MKLKNLKDFYERKEYMDIQLSPHFIKTFSILKNMVESKGYKVEEIFPKGLEITGEQYTQALETLKTLKAKGA